MPLSFGEKLVVSSVSAKPGQTVDEGQVLVTTDATAIQIALDAARARLDADTTSLTQAQASAVAQQAAAADQAAAAQQARADRVAAAQASLSNANANLQKVQAGASSADIRAAEIAVTSAQMAQSTAEADQAKAAAGSDPALMRSAEQELATAQAALVRAQAEFDNMPGARTLAGSTNQAGPVLAENISPPGVSLDSSIQLYSGGFQAIAVDRSHPSTVYAGSSGQGLWKTTDGGHTWAKVNTGTNGKALDSGGLWLVVLDPTNTQVVYAASGYGVQGLWKSTDGGVNWTALFPANSPVSQELGAPPTPSNLAIDPANHLHMIASSHFGWGTKYQSVNGSGVLESSDGGATWTIHAPIKNSGAEHQVALIDSATWLESFNGGTYRTTDAGASWTKVSDANAQTQSMITVNGALYLPAPSGLMRSTDKGASWQTVGPGSMAIMNDGVNLYVQDSGPGGGHPSPLYFSPVSDGANWAQYSTQIMCTGTACDGPVSVDYDPVNHIIYMANWTAGVWKLQTSGGNPIAAVPPPAAATRVGPGAADVLASRQRLDMAKATADAARAKLEALQTPGPNTVDPEEAQFGVDSAQLAVQAAQAHLDQLRGGPSPAALRSARDAVDQARAALDREQNDANADQGNDLTDDFTSTDLTSRQKAIDKDNTEIDKLDKRLSATQLVAPFSGTVVSIRVKAGDTADATRPAASIAKPGSPLVRATVTPADMNKVSVGQAALVQPPGQPDSAPPLSGTVISLTPNDAGTARTATIELAWPGDSPKLGTALNVGLVLQQKDDALLVPKKAVHTVNSRTFVEFMDGNTRRVLNVELGIVGATDAEIVGGLSLGQLVIVGP